MRFCAVLSFLLIFVLIGSVSAADTGTNASEMISASDNNEILTVEHDLEVLSNNPGKYSDLSTEISAGGDVTLAHDYYNYDSGAEAITISGDNRVIDGNGAVIDMAGSNIRAFNVTGSGVTIKNLTIKNTHYEGDGGAVYFSSSGTVENCSFVNNEESRYGGAIYFFLSGIVTNCNFVNNTAGKQGGAVYMSSGGSVVNCSFVNNSVTGNSASGGAISIVTGSGSVVNCSFVNNSATGNNGGGGAVNIATGSVVNCSFVNNTAGKQGGAVYMSGGSVVNCSFVNNSVTGNSASGGAVYIASAARSFSVVNCSFENNRGNYKNIYNSGRSLTLEDNKFLDTSITLNNTEFDYGTDFTVNGTVDVGVNVAIDDLIFKLNDTAVHTYTLDVSSDMKFSFDVGGTELDPGNYKITATNDVFNNAYTLTGSQIFTVKGDTIGDFNTIQELINAASENSVVDLTRNYTFTVGKDENLAGGISVNKNGLTIDGHGYIIYALGLARVFKVTASEVTIKNLTIKNANYNGDGAAIYFDNLGTVENCNFIDNVASSGGGAIYFFYLGSSHEGNCKVKNCNFINNKVTGSGSGGAVYFPDVYGCAVENCNFTNNSAYYGGAIYFLFSSRGTVENCNFIDNFASANGGAVFSDADDLIFEKCNFINNTASGDGDAIYLAGGSVSVNDNWWGSNNPDFTKLIKGVTPSSYAVLNVAADSQSIAPGSKATLNYAFYRNGTSDVVSLPLRSISLSTTGGQLDDDSGYLVDGRFSTQFGSSVGGNFEITATVDNQELKTNIVVDDPTPHPVLLPSKVTVPSRTSADYGTDVIIQATDLVNAYGIGAILLDSNGAKIRDLDVSGLNIFVDTDDLNVGTYNVLVYTLVDTTKYYSYSTYSALFINKGTAVVSVDIGDVEYGKPIDVSVDVLGGTGKVNVTVAGITKSSDLVNGSSKFTFDAITNPGKYDVDVVYYGDAKYDDFHTSKSIEVVAPSVIIADNIRRGVNSPYDYCATLLDANAKPIAGREITFTIAGKTLKATTDANGIAKVSAGLVLVDNAETVYDVVVTNPDTLENVTATTTIVPRLLVVSGDLTADYLENPPYVVQAIGDDANPVGEGETVNVVFAGFGYDMLTNATGHVVRTIGLAPGMYAVKACYKGYNTTATVFVVNQILKVTSGALKKTAKSYTLKATLKNSNGKAIAGKEVKLTFNGKTYNATTNSKGVASYKIGSKIIKKLKAGKTYTLQARYVNDIAKGKIKVEK